MKISWKHGLLIALAAAGASALGQPVDKTAVRRSVFVMPTNPQEGRDPFYPESTRPYASAVVSHVAPVTTTLVIKEIGRAHV